MPLKNLKFVRRTIIAVGIIAAGLFMARFFYEQSILQKIITRLRADSRVAEVLVTGVNYNQALSKNFTTIKFLEYGTDQKALPAKYFTFPGNVIQFQALVVRFDDHFIMAGDKLKGKSVYLFWKAFMLDGANTKEFPINYIREIPQGSKLEGAGNWVEDKFWQNFWRYAFNKDTAGNAGVKNVQIEAPGAMFVPGYLYTVKIEHNGGLRIDTSPLPGIVRGERID